MLQQLDNPNLIFPKSILGSLGIMLGYKFKTSCLMFFIPYWYIFLLDKSYWNNHSYLYGILAVLFTGTCANHWWLVFGKCTFRISLIFFVILAVLWMLFWTRTNATNPYRTGIISFWSFKYFCFIFTPVWRRPIWNGLKDTPWLIWDNIGCLILSS